MALAATRKIEGPRLDDLSVTTADYGTPMVQFYGTKRLECFCMYAEKIREKKKKNKTKGGKYVEYQYFGTWANFIADHQIDAVLKIWLDRHLVLDRTGTGGPVTRLIDGPLGIDLKLENSNALRIYYGTETQEPDPRLLAKIEEREGAGMCPAYLGISYMVFEEVPLEKFGNRMPQVSCVATRNKTDKYPFERFADIGGNGSGHLVFSPTGTWAMRYGGAGDTMWYSGATRTYLGNSPMPNVLAGSVDAAALDEFGVAHFYGIRGGPTRLYLIEVPPLGPPVLTQCDVASFDIRVVRMVGISTFGIMDDGTGYYLDAMYITHTQRLLDVCASIDDELWMLFEPDGASDEFTLENHAVTPMVSYTFTGVARSNPGVNSYLFDTPYNQFIVLTDNHFYIIDKTTMTISSSGSLTIDVANRELNERRPNSSTFWDVDSVSGGGGYKEYDCRDCSLIRTLNKMSWTLSSADTQEYDPGNHAVWETDTSSDDLIIRYLDRADGGGWTLGAICDDVAEQAGLLATERDFDNLDQVVDGYSWTQGPAKEIVAPLLELWDSDIRPHEWIQQGLKRGQPLSGETISSEFLVPNGDEPLYQIPITAETDLPRRIFATFADPTMEEQPNTAIAQRNAASVKTKRETSYDLTTLNIHPDDIQPLLERDLRRQWVGATKPNCTLNPLEIRNEPGDVRHLMLEDGERMRCKCTRTTIRPNRAIYSEWEVDGEVQINEPLWQDDDANPIDAVFNSPGAQTGGRPDEPVLVPIQTKGLVIDTVLLTDSDDQTTPFLYDGAAPYGPEFWPGALVFSADLNEDDTIYAPGFDSFNSTEQMTWGYVTTAPGTSPLTTVWDEASVIDVVLPNGETLSSVTEDEVIADQSVNLALVNEELIQFRSASLIGTNTWRLSGLLRGVRGTEWATSNHAVGEYFVLIDASLHKVSMGASEIGDTDYYKFSTTGEDLDSTAPQTVTFQARAHMPLSPAQLELERDAGTGDWTISWQRRTRIGGSTIDGQDVPLGESSELYRVKIMSGSSVLASYDVTSEQKVYTAAEQTTDWGSPQTSLAVEVVQVSPVLSLEGFTAEASA